MDRIGVIVLCWLNNVNKVDFGRFPMMIVLMVLMLRFRDVVVIRDPIIL